MLTLDCGKRKEQIENAETKLLVGGKESTFGEWPWQIFIMREPGNKRNNIEYCGGAVLSEHFILTAAHCFFNSKSIFYHII